MEDAFGVQSGGEEVDEDEAARVLLTDCSGGSAASLAKRAQLLRGPRRRVHGKRALPLPQWRASDIDALQGRLAGWGVAVYTRLRGVGARLRLPGAVPPVHEFFGQVDNRVDSQWHVSATEHTNNIGELAALAVALSWSSMALGTSPICIYYDSEYAARLTQGLYALRRNMELASAVGGEPRQVR